MLERESRRERILEAKAREIMLKSKAAQKVAPIVHHHAEDDGQPKLSPDQIACNTAAEEYEVLLEKDMKLRAPEEICDDPLGGMGTSSPPAKELEPGDEAAADKEVQEIEAKEDGKDKPEG
jgi:hypothetical protein